MVCYRWIYIIEGHGQTKLEQRTGTARGAQVESAPTAPTVYQALDYLPTVRQYILQGSSWHLAGQLSSPPVDLSTAWGT